MVSENRSEREREIGNEYSGLEQMLLLTQTADILYFLCKALSRERAGHRASPSHSAHFLADAEVLALSILRNSSYAVRMFC